MTAPEEGGVAPPCAPGTVAGASTAAGDKATDASRLVTLRESGVGLDDPIGLRRTAVARGYLFFRALLPAADVVALRDRVLQTCAELGWLREDVPVADGVVGPEASIGIGGEEWMTLQRRVQASPEFRRLRGHPAIDGVLASVFGSSVRPGCGDICRVLPPARPELTTRPHQDRVYVRRDTDLWTVWIPLGDCPVELGGLAVIPASHLEGPRLHGSGDRGIEAAPDAGWAATDYRCGDVLMFHGLTIHRALDNRTSDRLRISVDFRYEST